MLELLKISQVKSENNFIHMLLTVVGIASIFFSLTFTIFSLNVIDASSNETSSSSFAEKYLEVGKQTSEEIDSNLSEEHILLKIQRFGLGKDTSQTNHILKI